MTTTMSSRLLQCQYKEECTYPSLGELLPDYAVGLLEDSASEEVEDHILDCLHCREMYLKMLCVEGTGRGNVEPRVAPPNNAHAHASTKVVSMADFKRRRL
jgi:predicted anti-sigma-YlaC factor YlaD